jgi:hypothetical protein
MSNNNSNLFENKVEIFLKNRLEMKILIKITLFQMIQLKQVIYLEV